MANNTPTRSHSKMSNKPYFRVIGDVHAHYRKYMELANKAQHSVQLGDMGFDYKQIESLDSKKHCFFGGNHDNYDTYYDCEHALEDFGAKMVGPILFFYVRGAYSIDWMNRIKIEQCGGGKGWWREEELSWRDMKDCLDAYTRCRPRLVITHDCPDFLSRIIGKPYVLKNFGYNPDTFTTNTQQLLESCYRAHQPQVWIHGHFHCSYQRVEGNTLFVGLDELGCLDITKEGEIKIGNHTRSIL